MEDPFAAPSSSGGLGVPKAHKPTLSVLLRDTDLPEQAEGESVDLPSVPALRHELFTGDEFDTSDFLLGRRHVALEELRSELRAYLATLRASLVEVINTEYESFIGLSLGLRHAAVSTSLSTIRRPVVSIRSEVLRVKSQLEVMREEMAGVLSERKEVRDVKATLRRLLEMEEAVEKVESLLKLGDGNGKKRELDKHVDSPAKRLERIASEYNHMLYLVEKAGDLPFVRSLDPRLKRIASTLQLDLSQLLTSTISLPPNGSTKSPPPSRDAVLSLLRTYSSLNAVPVAEDLIRQAIVRPGIAKIIHRDVLNEPFPPLVADSPRVDQRPSTPSQRPSTPTSRLGAAFSEGSDDHRVPSFYSFDRIGSSADGSPPPLAQLYNQILSFVSRECGVLLDVGERTLASPHHNALALRDTNGEQDTKSRSRTGYEILANVVWDEVATRLMSELGGFIFAAGRPSIFHENYTLTLAFISAFESWCPTTVHLRALRNHPTFLSFTRRFQLPVYFQLRFKEIAMSVERALEIGSASGGGDTFVMSESEAAWRALNTCWSDDVLLEELTGRFWRLMLQILSRYRSWINDAVPKYVLPSSASNANLSAANPTAARTSFDGDRSRMNSAGNSRPGTPSLAGEDVTEESTLRQLTVLIADARLMEKRALALFDDRIKLRLPGREDHADPESARSILEESLRQLTSIVPSLSSQIVTILVRRCADHLKHVRSVASQVRASTRKGPAEPSYFVPNILKELRAYMTGPGRVIEAELKTKWATAVAEEVASRYATILSTQKKTEDSYRWYKKGRQGLSFFGRGASAADETGAGGSEEDKVKMQMQLDVATLAQDAEGLGVDVEASDAFKTLRGATQDAPAPSEDKK